MDSAFFSAAIVWGALGFALACVILRLMTPPPPHPMGMTELPSIDAPLPGAETPGPAEALAPRAAGRQPG